MAPGNANVAEQFSEPGTIGPRHCPGFRAERSAQRQRPCHGRLPPDAEAGAGALVAAINGPAVGPKAAIVISIAETGARA